MTQQILILGVGNLLLSDEGIGVHVAQALLDRYDFSPDVEIVDGGTCGMELLPYVAEASHLILLDAVITGNDPGTVVKMEGDDIPAFFRTKMSPHQVGLSEVLATAIMTEEFPNELALFGVVPQSLKTSMELTPLIASKIEKVIGHVIDQVTAWGGQVQAKPNLDMPHMDAPWQGAT